jgi:hypothetical protein
MAERVRTWGEKIHRIHDPSWRILQVLSPVDPIPGVEITGRVGSALAVAGYPAERLDPTTLHHALARLSRDGLIAPVGRRVVEVPGPRGSTRAQLREVYVITADGQRALRLRARLAAALARQAARPWRARAGPPAAAEPPGGQRAARPSSRRSRGTDAGAVGRQPKAELPP